MATAVGASKLAARKAPAATVPAPPSAFVRAVATTRSKPVVAIR